MSRKFLVSMMSVGSALAISLSTYAAEPIGYMENFTGQVFIKHDGIIYSAAPRAALYSGDEVVTVNGSSAVVTFSGECSLDLNENSLVLLVSQSQCNGVSNIIPLESNSPYYGYTFSGANGTLTAGHAPITGGLESGTGVLIPVTLVAGAGLVAAAVSGKDDTTVNSSP